MIESLIVAGIVVVAATFALMGLCLVSDRARRFIIGRAWYAGHCRECNYDLTGLKKTDVCPECGTPFRRRKPASTTVSPHESATTDE